MKKLLFLLLLSPFALGADWLVGRANQNGNAKVDGTLKVPLQRLWAVKTSGSIESTPVVQGKRLVVGTMAGYLESRNLTNGKLLWSTKNHSAFSASPAIDGSLVFIGDEGGEFHCYQIATGKQKWSFETGDKITSSALVVGARVIFGSYDGNLYCLDKTTGRKVWSFKNEAQVHCGPAIQGNLVWIAGCDGNVISVNLTNGKRNTVAKIGGNFSVSPCLSGGKLFAGNTSGVLCAVDTKSGRALWQLREKEEDSGYYGSPVAAGSLVAFPSRSARVFAVDPGNAGVRWTYKTEAPVDSSLVAIGTKLVFGDDKGVLHVVDALTGRGIWTTRLGGEIKGSASYSAGTLLVGATDGRLWAFANSR